MSHARYDDLTARAAMLTLAGFRWCPAPGCPAGQVDADCAANVGAGASSDPGPVPASVSPPSTTTATTATTTMTASTTATPVTPHDATTTCHACSHASCALCAAPPHVGTTCGAAAKTSAEAEAERQSDAWLRRNAKPCPGRGCGRRIEKAGGCDVVQCTTCWVVFCWNTGNVFED